MLDSLGGKQQQSSPWFDSLSTSSTTMNSNSSVSSGSPPSLSSHLRDNSDVLSRPTWLFNSQPVHDPLSTPTEALSSLLDTFSSPVSDNCGGFSIGQLTGSPYKQMASSNRFAQPSRRAFGIMSSHYDTSNSLGAPGTPINGNSMASANINPMVGVVTPPNAPPPKNPKLYKTELCRSWMDHGRCNYGERCQYAHGEQEKRPIPRHPKYKTEACQSYHQSGYCPYGPRCHFIHSEADLLANLQTPPTSTMRPNHNAFMPPVCSQQLSSSSYGTHLSQAMGAQGNSLRNQMLQRMSSLPGYGSTGESTAGSSSSADSGSESPNGSFSPGLDLDDNGPFGAGFMAPLPVNQRTTNGLGVAPAQQQQTQLSNSYNNYDLSRTSDPMMNGLIGDIMSLTFDEKWEKAPGRLPVFAQLSNGQ
ncbi:unnamed protein product [Cylicocyclus nassatus]|uniref:C3H1-type domain-containing protein n=1 Tax=Cylicocyclus nassatus TaxID=53992 RepID=A0AA36DLJ6_CYLNA|nr:unnamed protein product [Cylicocyclus nassatus]